MSSPVALDAYRAVQQAVADGTLIRPEACEICGVTPRPMKIYSAGKGVDTASIVAHHPRGYDEDHALDVQWLCRRCHSRVHCLPERQARAIERKLTRESN